MKKDPTQPTAKAEQLADSILAEMRGELIDFLRDQEAPTSSLDYENGLLDLARTLARKVTSQQAGPLPKSRNSKKNPDQFRSSPSAQGTRFMPRDKDICHE
jgi:hypothetical protein